MAKAENRKLLAIWALLVIVTLVSWFLGAHRGPATFERHVGITWGVVLIAAFKIRLILRGFMEVSHSPRWLMRLTDLWLMFAIAMLMVPYSFDWGLTA